MKSNYIEAIDVVKKIQRLFLKSIWPSDKLFDVGFLKYLEDSEFFLYAAGHQLLVNGSDYVESFLHTHNITYIDEFIDQNVKVKVNFPLLPRILKQYMYEIYDPSEHVDISRYPAAKGYLLEEMFFAIIKNAYLPVALFVNNEVVFNMFAIPAVKRSEEVLLQIQEGVMYHLRDGHPVIDGIGLLENEAGEY